MYGRKVVHMQGAKKILKPECTPVHEARFIVWHDFAATHLMGEFLPIHNLEKQPGLIQ